MEIDPSLAGTPLKDFVTDISWRKTTNYAAAVQDHNPVYFDDERPGGLIAPPMFSVAVTWPILERLWEFIELEKFPREILATQVHYSEHLIFHSPLRPGTKVRVKGEIVAILPHRAGTHMIMRLKAEDERGQPLFTEYIGGMMRGVHCAGEGKGKEALPVVPKPPNNGNSLWEQEIQIGPLFPYIYDGCTDIVFPIHTSPKFARQVGLPGIIVQGTATLAFAAREIVNRNGNGDPTRLREISCRFRAMVRPDTNLTVRAKHLVEKEEYDEIFFEALNGDGDIALSNGYARIRS